jgi:hypothetical protein
MEQKQFALEDAQSARIETAAPSPAGSIATANARSTTTDAASHLPRLRYLTRHPSAQFTPAQAQHQPKALHSRDLLS